MFPIAVLHCIITMIENDKISEIINYWKYQKDKCCRIKFKKLSYKYQLFMYQIRQIKKLIKIYEFNTTNTNMLKSKGFILYQKKNNNIIKIYKYKSRHREVDNLYFNSKKYDLNTYHHLDYYVNQNNTVLNTNVYTSKINN